MALCVVCQASSINKLHFVLSYWVFEWKGRKKEVISLGFGLCLLSLSLCFDFMMRMEAKIIIILFFIICSVYFFVYQCFFLRGEHVQGIWDARHPTFLSTLDFHYYFFLSYALAMCFWVFILANNNRMA